MATWPRQAAVVARGESVGFASLSVVTLVVEATLVFVELLKTLSAVYTLLAVAYGTGDATNRVAAVFGALAGPNRWQRRKHRWRPRQ